MYCDMCKSTVYADDVHSCYDADAVVVLRDRERAVIDAALAWGDDEDYERYVTGQKLWEAVCALREVMP